MTFRLDVPQTKSPNGIQTHSNLVRKRTLSHLAIQASVAEWVSFGLGTKWLWAVIWLLSLKTSDITPILSKELFKIPATLGSRFALKQTL